MTAPNTAAGANLPPRPSNPPRPNRPNRSNIPNRPNAPNRTQAANNANMPRRPNVESHPNLPGEKARNRSLQKSLSYTSRLRSAGPMSNDPDTERIKARLTTGGTAAEIAEEGYRVCRLNTSLRRDLDEATDQLLSPMSKDDDSARIKNRLDDGGTAKQIAEEAYRVCRINTYLRKNKDEAQAELRVLKKRSAITEDALQELRPEAAATRKVLDRAWKLIASRKIKIPDDLAEAYAASYAALNTKDEYDWQPRKGAKVNKRLTKQEEDEKRRELQRKKSGKKDNGKAKEPEKTKFLLHTHGGKTYDLRVPLADQDEIDEEDEEDTKSTRSEPGDNADDSGSRDEPSTQATPTNASADGVAIAENVVAGIKRKNNSTPDQKSKKPKIDTDHDHDHDLKDKETISPDIPLAPPKPRNPFATLKRKDPPAMGALPKKVKLDVSESMSSDPDFWKSKIHLSATECWEEGIKLSAPPFPFKQSWDPASEGMQERAKKVEDEDADFEEGETKE